MSGSWAEQSENKTAKQEMPNSVKIARGIALEADKPRGLEEQSRWSM